MTNKLRSYIARTLWAADHATTDKEDDDGRARLKVACAIAETECITCSMLPRNCRVFVSAYTVRRRGHDKVFSLIESSRPLRPARVQHRRVLLFLKHEEKIRSDIDAELWVGWEFWPGQLRDQRKPQYA